MKARAKSRAQWLAEATDEQLSYMGLLRSGACAHCGEHGDPEDECHFCYSPAGVAFHAEADALGLTQAERRARHLGTVQAVDERQGVLL